MKSVIYDIETDEKSFVNFTSEAKICEFADGFSVSFAMPSESGSASSEYCVEVKENRAVITEKGESECEIVLDGESHTANYKTPLGNFDLKIENGVAETVLGKRKITLLLSYGATLGGLDGQKVKIRIDIEKEGKNDR